jgi:hypothetical protein
MYIGLSGTIPIEHLGAAFAPLTSFLKSEGLDRVSNFSVSFDGWRGERRCRILGKHGYVGLVRFDPAASGFNPQAHLALPDGLRICDRSDEFDFDPFKLMMGDLFE